VDRPDFPHRRRLLLARTSFFPNATINLDLSPEYLGVGS
jgi:hypothetical protein